MNSTAVKPPVAPTKLCHLIKRPDFEGYGFNLHSEKMKPGQFIGKVDAGSPAEMAGLKTGDRIIEVNGVSIGNETHKQVVQRIKAIENEVRLMLIDVDVGITTTTSTTIESLQKQQQQQSEEVHDIDTNQDSDEFKTNISNQQITNNNNNNNKTKKSDEPQQQQQDNNNKTHNENDSSQLIITTTTITSTPTSSSTSSQQKQQNNNANTLHLPLTAAEMRAKLMSKKKYDPKSESVDIKKKFQIIQTL